MGRRRPRLRDHSSMSRHRRCHHLIAPAMTARYTAPPHGGLRAMPYTLPLSPALTRRLAPVPPRHGPSSTTQPLASDGTPSRTRFRTGPITPPTASHPRFRPPAPTCRPLRSLLREHDIGERPPRLLDVSHSRLTHHTRGSAATRAQIFRSDRRHRPRRHPPLVRRIRRVRQKDSQRAPERFGRVAGVLSRAPPEDVGGGPEEVGVEEKGCVPAAATFQNSSRTRHPVSRSRARRDFS